MDRNDLDSDSSDSWVSLSLSDVEIDEAMVIQGLSCHNVEEVLLEAQKERSTRSNSPRTSKCSSVASSPSINSSPSLRSFQNSTDVSSQASGRNSPSNSSKTKVIQDKYLIVKLKEPKRNLDKVMEWSCQPPLLPSKYSRLPSVQNSASQTSGHNSSVNCTQAKATQCGPLDHELPNSEVNSDWVWDWSSQPTANPPKKPQFHHPKRKATPLSFRNSKAMKCDVFSWEFLKVFIPSFIFSNLITFGLGLYLGRKMSVSKRLL